MVLQMDQRAEHTASTLRFGVGLLHRIPPTPLGPLAHIPTSPGIHLQVTSLCPHYSLTQDRCPPAIQVLQDTATLHPDNVQISHTPSIGIRSEG